MSFNNEQGMGQLDRITQQPRVMGGKACIRGMRVTAGMVVGQIGAGQSVGEILADYPYLERQDIIRRFATPHGMHSTETGHSVHGKLDRNHAIYRGDNGRVLGFDNAHGYHHRHYMGDIERSSS